MLKKILTLIMAVCVSFPVLMVPTYADFATQGGFEDEHSRNGINGWAVVGGRQWEESNGTLSPKVPSYNMKQPNYATSFIITEYPCSDNGTFESNMTSDQWNGQNGGLIFRWSSPKQYYYVTVKPGNQWTSKLTFHKNNMDESQGIVVAQNFLVDTNYNLKVVVMGNQFDIYLNGQLMGTVNDDTNQYGRVGYGYTTQWNSYISVNASKWVDAPNSIVSKPVDPEAGKVELKVFVKDEAFSSSNQLSPRIYIENTGEVAATNFKCYYFFNAEEGKVPVLEDHYTPESTPSLIDLGDNKYIIEYAFSGIQLAPGERTPDPNGNVVTIHYEDWSAMDKTNDYSNPGSAEVCLTDKIAVEGYYKLNEQYTVNAGQGGGQTSSGIKLVGGSIPTQTYTMNRLRLIKLVCEDTTDDDDWNPWGYDLVGVKVFVDGKGVKDIFCGRMSEDYDDKNFTDEENEYLEFNDSVIIKLLDMESAGDWDTTDYIGQNNLPTSVGERVERFNRDGKYDLTYSITQIQLQQAFTTLWEYQLFSFEQSQKNGVWDKINKKSLIDDMKSKLIKLYPAKFYGQGILGTGVSQGDLNFCGPASVTHELIRTNPLRYVILCRDVFEKGYYKGIKNTYNASAALRSCKVPDDLTIYSNNPVSCADWLVMSTIRDGTDPLIYPRPDGFPVTEEKGIHLNGVDDTDLYIKWLKDILGHSYVDLDTSYLWGEDTIIRKCEENYAKGNTSILRVNADILFEGDDSDWYIKDDFKSNHAIAYAGGLEISNGSMYSWDGGNVKFKCFTWGEIKDVDVTEERFEDSLFGAAHGN
jgi:hypothetical protein